MWSVVVSHNGTQLAKYTYESYVVALDAYRTVRAVHRETCRNVTVRLFREDE